MGYEDQRRNVENAVTPGIEKNAGVHHDNARTILGIANQRFERRPGQQLKN